MRKLKLLTSMVVLAAFASPTMAADLYTPVEPVAYDWSGFYIGGHAGWGFINSKWKVRDIDDVPVGSFSLNPDGFLGGGQIGFNFDSNGFVWGGEAEFTFGGGSDSSWYDDTLFDGRSRVNFLMTLGPRVGVAMDRTLFYVEGGLALVDRDHRLLDLDVGGLSDRSSSTRTGWFIGGGGEYAFDDNWSAKLEYNYVDLSSDSLDFAVIDPGGREDLIKVDNYMHVIKAGINFKF